MDDLETKALMAQIDALSISGSDLSLNTTIVGIGSLSGRVLMAVGELTLRGMESVNLRIKLRTLASKLAQQDKTAVSDAAYDLLLEFQRAGLYSDSIRFAAWDLILGEMELGQTEGIIGGVLRWPWIEIEVFIRQLALTRSKEWGFYPGSTVERRSRNSERLGRESVADMATKSFRSMLKAILFHFQTEFDLEKMITIEDSDSESIILYLSPKELYRTLDWLAQRTLPEIRQFMQQILILPLQRDGHKSAYRVLSVLSRFWRREPNLMRAVVPLDQIAPFLTTESDGTANQDTVPPEVPYYRSLLAVADKIHTLPDLEQCIFVLAVATEPIILMLPRASMQEFLSIVMSLSLSRKTRYLKALVLTKTPNWSRYPAQLSTQIVDNLAELFGTIRQASDPAVRELLPLDWLLKFVPDEIQHSSDQIVLRALLRHVTTTDDLDLLKPIIDASRGFTTVLRWTDGTQALLRILVEGNKQLSDIQRYLRQFVFTSSFHPSTLLQADRQDTLGDNLAMLVAASWNKNPSYIGAVLKNEWIVALCSSTNIHDPVHRIFQVILQLSRESTDLELVNSLPHTLSPVEITERIDGLTSSQTELYLYQVSLSKAIQWSESVDEEAVVEQILHVFVHVWKREHAIINRFLDRVYADGMQPTSKHGKTVRNIAQCILIALLNNIEQLSDLHDLMPRLRLERMPVFLLTSTSGLRNLVQLLLVEDRGELETYLQVVVMSKLEACARHPLKVRQRIVKNLLEMVAVLWKPNMRIKCPNLDINLRWIMDSFLPTRQTSTEDGTIDWQFVVLMNCISSATNLPLGVEQLPFEEAAKRLQDLSKSLDGKRRSILTNGDTEANIWIYLRCLLHQISSSPSMEFSSSTIYDILFELLRTHPRGAVRLATWDIILLNLGRGATQHLTDSLLRRSDAEAGVILRQLKDMKKSQWTIYPNASDERAPSTPYSGASSDPKLGDYATESFLQLLLVLFEKNPAVIHATFSWDDLLEVVNTANTGSHIMLTPMLLEETLTSSLSPPTELRCCIRFLETGTHINRAAFSLTTYNDLVSTLHVSLPRMHGDKITPSNYAIQTAVAMDPKVNILISYQNDYSFSVSESVLFCLLLVHAWGDQHDDEDRHTPRSLMEHLQQNKKTTAEVFKWPYSNDSSRMDTWAILYMLEYLTLAEDNKTISKLHWIKLLTLFDHQYFASWIDDVVLSRAYCVIICCAASAETQWVPLVAALQHDTSAPPLGAMLRQFRLMSTQIPRVLVRRLYVRAKLRGVAVANPINRFVLLLREASRQNMTVQRALRLHARSESLKLLKDVQRGQFDHLGHPSDAEKVIRDAACGELTSLIEN